MSTQKQWEKSFSEGVVIGGRSLKPDSAAMTSRCSRFPPRCPAGREARSQNSIVTTTLHREWIPSRWRASLLGGRFSPTRQLGPEGESPTALHSDHCPSLPILSSRGLPAGDLSEGRALKTLVRVSWALLPKTFLLAPRCCDAVSECCPSLVAPG